MKIWPGAWLNCVVCSDRTMAMSSAIFAVYGSSSEISAPLPPWRANRYGDPSSFGVPLMNAKRSPFGRNSSGMALPSRCCSAGL